MIRVSEPVAAMARLGGSGPAAAGWGAIAGEFLRQTFKLGRTVFGLNPSNGDSIPKPQEIQ